jgi:hypothetical protein
VNFRNCRTITKGKRKRLITYCLTHGREFSRCVTALEGQVPEAKPQETKLKPSEVKSKPSEVKPKGSNPRRLGG